MDEMAAMLTDYAGGLQQSFATVFDRVGQSLSQSASLMQMMNEVMEAALLQNLLVQCTFDASDSARALRVSLQNDSQIVVAAVTVAVRLDHQDQDAFAADLQALAPGDKRELVVPLENRTPELSGSVRLALTSPGTQQPLEKTVPFRVFLFEQGVFETVAIDAVALSSDALDESPTISLEAVRRALRLSPLDAMLTFDKGCYRFVLANNGAPSDVLYVWIKSDPSQTPQYHVGVSGQSHAWRQRMLRDLEELSAQLK